MKSARFVIGLGNPGKSYEKTRHNFGFQVLDEWAQSEGKNWRKSSHMPALMVEMESGQFLIKPQTFMNLSGEVVRKVIQWWKCDFKELLIVVDDVALPIGKMRLRSQGSSGGHNGLRSVEEALGGREYPRLRLGIGAERLTSEQPEQKKRDLADYVLGVFTKQEEEIVEKIKKKAITVIKDCYTHGLEYSIIQANKHL